MECLDRLYLNGYIRPLAPWGGVVTLGENNRANQSSPVVLGAGGREVVANDFLRKRDILNGVIFVQLAQQKPHFGLATNSK